MLQITVPETEQWDEALNEFVYTKRQTLALEHSLVSISKWEAKWKKPFLTEKAKTKAEMTDYVRCMTLTQNVSPDVYLCLTRENYAQITQYIDDQMTATWFSERDGGKGSREQVTSELIYYWMVALNIPFECQKWHLNRLMTLIRICSIKNGKPKKMSGREVMSRNAALNAARRKKLNTKG